MTSNELMDSAAFVLEFVGLEAIDLPIGRALSLAVDLLAGEIGGDPGSFSLRQLVNRAAGRRLAKRREQAEMVSADPPTADQTPALDDESIRLLRTLAQH